MGLDKSAEYRAWNHMLNRCRNPRVPAFPKYGGRGIKVCDRWQGSYENFLLDMGRRPSADHSLDRIDNNGDYEPSNCRWATDEQQRYNKRTTKLIEYDGGNLTILEASKVAGVPLRTLRRRLKRGWSPKDAVERPLRPYPS